MKTLCIVVLIMDHFWVGPVSAQPPFILDLSGGALRPGEVIGSVGPSGVVDPVPSQGAMPVPPATRQEPPPISFQPADPQLQRVETFPLRVPAPVVDPVSVDPVPRNVGIDPVPNYSGVDPVPNNVGVDPVPNNVGVDPVPNYSGVDPVPNNVGVDPVPNNVGVDPVPNNVVVDPVPNNVVVDPVPNNVVVDPVPNNVVVDPVSNNVVVDPVPNNVGVDPVPNNVVVDPVPNNVVVDPVSNNVGVDPVPNNVGIDPVPNNVVVNPVPNKVVVGSVSNNVVVDSAPNNAGVYPAPVGVNQVNAGPVPTGPTVGSAKYLPAFVVADPVPNNVAVETGPLMVDTSATSGPNAIDWTCEGYRPHPTNRNMYQVFFNNQWADYSCFGILYWNQTLCSCLVPKDTSEVDPNCPNNRAHATDPVMYHIKHWGVWLTNPKRCPVNQLWNQTGCRCDWDPLGPGGVVDVPVGGLCDLMFNATFTTALRDDANYNAIGKFPWFNVKVENGTARLDDGRMPVWAFAGNDFGRDFQVEGRFRVDNVASNRNRYTTLLSNDCEYDRPSVSVSYRPVDQSFQVFFRDEFSNSTLQCAAPTRTPYDFQALSLEYQSSLLVLKVNGVPCVESYKFSGNVAISRCPFYLGGDGRQQYMTGNIDDVVIRRFCVFPV